MRAQETETRTVKQIKHTENEPILMHSLCKSAHASTHATDVHTHANITHKDTHANTHTCKHTHVHINPNTERGSEYSSGGGISSRSSSTGSFFLFSKTICCQNKRGKELLRERMLSERHHVDRRERECVEVCLKKREKERARER